jgi:hypothetical protein
MMLNMPQIPMLLPVLEQKLKDAEVMNMAIRDMSQTDILALCRAVMESADWRSLLCPIGAAAFAQVCEEHCGPRETVSPGQGVVGSEDRRAA